MSVYWITGLSGSGKTTLAQKLVQYMVEERCQPVFLDGDELRKVMNATIGHSREERLQLAKRYAHLCHLIASQGIDVVIATISLFREVHDWNRANLPGYTEIFLDIPISELERRDPKNIYKKAARGELKNVAGLDFEVDYPVMPDIKLSWQEDFTIEKAFDELLNKLKLLE